MLVAGAWMKVFQSHCGSSWLSPWKKITLTFHSACFKYSLLHTRSIIRNIKVNSIDGFNHHQCKSYFRKCKGSEQTLKIELHCRQSKCLLAPNVSRSYFYLHVGSKSQKYTMHMPLFSHKGSSVFEPEGSCGWQKHESYEIRYRVQLSQSIVRAYMYHDNCSSRSQWIQSNLYQPTNMLGLVNFYIFWLMS